MSCSTTPTVNPSTARNTPRLVPTSAPRWGGAIEAFLRTRFACRKKTSSELWSGSDHSEAEADSQCGVTTKVMSREGLALWMGSRSDIACIEVTGDSRGEIGCSADTTEPISFGAGAISGNGSVAFGASNWEVDRSVPNE